MYRLTRAGTDENANATGDLDVTENSRSLKITGAGQMVSIIDAGEIDRVFDVKAGAKLDLSHVTLAHGAAGDGAGIQNVGQLNIEHCDFMGNHAGSFFIPGTGGAISNSGKATITAANFFANTAELGGGAVANTGTMSLNSSVFSGDLRRAAAQLVNSLSNRPL